jgi:hypothetical protein
LYIFSQIWIQYRYSYKRIRVSRSIPKSQSSGALQDSKTQEQAAAANDDGSDKLLSVTYLKAKPNTPDWTGVQQTLTARLSSVEICLHQDALLDLASEATMWLAHMQARAAKLMAPAAATATDKEGGDELGGGGGGQGSGTASPMGKGVYMSTGTQYGTVPQIG